jgi:hypothetical protein
MTNNPELSNDRINGLSRRVYELEQELKAAKDDIGQLRNLIIKAEEISRLDDCVSTEAWEVFSVLRSWAIK